MAQHTGSERGGYLRRCGLRGCQPETRWDSRGGSTVLFSSRWPAARTMSWTCISPSAGPAKRSQLRWWQRTGAPPVNSALSQSICVVYHGQNISPITYSGADVRRSVAVRYPEGSHSYGDSKRDVMMATREKRTRASRALPPQLFRLPLGLTHLPSIAPLLSTRNTTKYNTGRGVEH